MFRLLMTICSLALMAVAVTSVAIPSAVDYPRYAFNYAVNDPLTHDNKGQWEQRDGGLVKGSYSLVEPDGSVRVVDYSADDLTGFNAVVKKLGPTVHSATRVPLAALSPAVPLPMPPINPILAPLNYGFGAAPLAIGLPKAASLGHWSLPWDTLTGSYGGWVPLGSHLPPYGPYATIISRKYDGKGRILHKMVTGPIPIGGKKLIIRKKHRNIFY